MIAAMELTQEDKDRVEAEERYRQQVQVKLAQEAKPPAWASLVSVAAILLLVAVVMKVAGGLHP